MAGVLQAATITVGPPGTSCDFDSIQAGIDVANEGDTVLVAPGEYVITEPITFRGKAITVKSEAGPDETTIRMGTPSDTKRGSVVVFENGETAASVLDGFTITGGRGCWGIDSLVGGGIFFSASSGTLRNCAIVQNKVEGDGGGVLCAYTCSPILIDCIIAENSAGGDGGGVLCAYTCSPILIDCIIAENSAELGFGGGVFAWSGASPSLSNCIVKDNSAKGTTYGSGGGGGVCCLTNASMTMSYCTIVENYSGQAGGGVFCGENSSSVSMTNCAIIGNTAGIGGGGLETFHQASATVTNCVIARNTAGTGGGIICAPYGYQGCSVTVTNSIIWGNNASEIRVSSGGTLGITYSNVDGGQTGVSLESGSTLNWGEGNIGADLYFANPNQDDFHLKSQAGRWEPATQAWMRDDVTSPCIDAGEPDSDWSGETWPHGERINMGAYGGMREASMSTRPEAMLLPRVAFIYRSDAEAAESFEALLMSYGCPTTLVGLDQTPAAALEDYDLIIVGDDTEDASAWDDLQVVPAIEGAGRPIVGMGEGGYDFFGMLELSIGRPHGMHGDGSRIYAIDPNGSLFTTPYPIHIPEDGIMPLYTETGHVLLYLWPVPDTVTVLAGSVGHPGYYPLALEHDRYVFWGFAESPLKMTEVGKTLFINVVIWTANAGWEIDI